MPTEQMRQQDEQPQPNINPMVLMLELPNREQKEATERLAEDMHNAVVNAEQIDSNRKRGRECSTSDDDDDDKSNDYTPRTPRTRRRGGLQSLPDHPMWWERLLSM